MISRDEIMRLMDYDPETGSFVWRERTPEMESNKRSRETFNAGYLGKPVGTTGLNSRDIRVFLRGKTYSLRSLAYLIMAGRLPEGRTVSIDGDSRNLRWKNIATTAEIKAGKKIEGVNEEDRPRVFSRGVVFSGQLGAYTAFFYLRFVKINVGIYDAPELASAARAERLKEIAAL